MICCRRLSHYVRPDDFDLEQGRHALSSVLSFLVAVDHDHLVRVSDFDLPGRRGSGMVSKPQYLGLPSLCGGGGCTSSVCLLAKNIGIGVLLVLIVVSMRSGGRRRPLKDRGVAIFLRFFLFFFFH